MKINIGNGELNGFLNLQNNSELELIPTNSATLIAAPFIFNSWTQDTVDQNLRLLYDRLKFGGELKLGGYDVVEFSKAVLKGQMTPQQINEIVQNSQNFMSLEYVTIQVKNAGFKIVSRKLEHMYFLIEAAK